MPRYFDAVPAATCGPIHRRREFATDTGPMDSLYVPADRTLGPLPRSTTR